MYHLPDYSIHVFDNGDLLPADAEEFFREELADSRKPMLEYRSDRDRWQCCQWVLGLRRIHGGRGGHCIGDTCVLFHWTVLMTTRPRTSLAQVVSEIHRIMEHKEEASLMTDVTRILSVR